MERTNRVGKNRQNFMFTLFLDAEVRPGVNSANIVKLLVATEFHVHSLDLFPLAVALP